MEDPVKEIPGIIKAMVQNEDFKLQEQTIFRYFSDSAVLDHPIVYCKGPWEILAGYQVWAMSNYNLQITIHQVIYKEDEDFLIVRLTQKVRKWWNPFDQKEMPMMVFLQLEDVPESNQENGNSQTRKARRKRIVLQQDYHGYEPVLVNLPVIGFLYTALSLRSIVTKFSSLIVKSVQATVGTQTVIHVGKSAFHLVGIS